MLHPSYEQALIVLGTIGIRRRLVLQVLHLTLNSLETWTTFEAGIFISIQLLNGTTSELRASACRLRCGSRVAFIGLTGFPFDPEQFRNLDYN